MEKLKEYNDYIRATKSYLRKLNQFKATAENRRELIEIWENELTHAENDIAAPIAQYGEKAGHGTPELNTVEMSAAKRELLSKKITRGKNELRRLEHIIRCVERSLSMLEKQDQEMIKLVGYCHKVLFIRKMGRRKRPPRRSGNCGNVIRK